MKYRYLIVNLEDGSVRGTNNKQPALTAAKEGINYVVIDALEGRTLIENFAVEPIGEDHDPLS